MDGVPLPDLNHLDRETLLALLRTQQEQHQKLGAMIAARDQELRRLEADLETHRHALSEQG